MESWWSCPWNLNRQYERRPPPQSSRWCWTACLRQWCGRHRYTHSLVLAHVTDIWILSHMENKWRQDADVLQKVKNWKIITTPIVLHIVSQSGQVLVAVWLRHACHADGFLEVWLSTGVHLVVVVGGYAQHDFTFPLALGSAWVVFKACWMKLGRSGKACSMLWEMMVHCHPFSHIVTKSLDMLVLCGAKLGRLSWPLHI